MVETAEYKINKWRWQALLFLKGRNNILQWMREENAQEHKRNQYGIREVESWGIFRSWHSLLE